MLKVLTDSGNLGIAAAVVALVVCTPFGLILATCWLTWRWKRRQWIRSRHDGTVTTDWRRAGNLLNPDGSITSRQLR